MDFQITGLSPDLFRPLFDLSDVQLAARGARRCVADAKPGFPCRVSLEDAEVGDELVLVPYEHHPADSPYRASGAIFARRRATTAFAATNRVPGSLRARLLSVRAYDAAGMMRDADVCEGKELERLVDRFFADRAIHYLHVHNARPGCFACRVDRASTSASP